MLQYYYPQIMGPHENYIYESRMYAKETKNNYRRERCGSFSLKLLENSLLRKKEKGCISFELIKKKGYTIELTNDCFKKLNENV